MKTLRTITEYSTEELKAWKAAYIRFNKTEGACFSLEQIETELAARSQYKSSKKDYNTCFGPFFPESLKATKETGIVDWRTARQWSKKAQEQIKYILAYETNTDKENCVLFEIEEIFIGEVGTQNFRVKEIPLPGKVAKTKQGFRSGYGMLEDFLVSNAA